MSNWFKHRGSLDRDVKLHRKSKNHHLPLKITSTAPHFLDHCQVLSTVVFFSSQYLHVLHALKKKRLLQLGLNQLLNFCIGSFHVKSTSGPQVTPSDFDETSSEWLDVAQMNTYKKAKSYSMSFSRYDPLKFGRGGHFVRARDAKCYFLPNVMNLHSI